MYELIIKNSLEQSGELYNTSGLIKNMVEIAQKFDELVELHKKRKENNGSKNRIL